MPIQNFRYRPACTSLFGLSSLFLALVSPAFGQSGESLIAPLPSPPTLRAPELESEAPVRQPPSRLDFQTSPLRPQSGATQTHLEQPASPQVPAGQPGTNLPNLGQPLPPRNPPADHNGAIDILAPNSSTPLNFQAPNPDSTAGLNPSPHPIQPATFHSPEPPEPQNGLSGFGGDPSLSSASNGLTPLGQNETTDTKPLDPIEKQYGDWWRDLLGKAEIEGQFLELHQILMQVPSQAQVQVVTDYWTLADSVAQYQIALESRDLWKKNNYAGSSLGQVVQQSLDSDVQIARNRLEQQQSSFHRLTQRYGLSFPARPADSPFVGPYSTRQQEFQLADPQWSVLAEEIKQTWDGILKEDQQLQWSDSQWQLSASRSGAADQMAALFLIRQRSMSSMAAQIVRYNQQIARYSLNVAGYGRNTEQRLAMLLRQPTVGGVVMDTRTDALFNQPMVSQPTAIAQVGYQGIEFQQQGVNNSPWDLNGQANQTPYNAQATYLGNPQQPSQSALNSLSTLSTQGLTERGSAMPTTFGNPAIQPSSANAWNAAQLPSNFRR